MVVHAFYPSDSGRQSRRLVKWKPAWVTKQEPHHIKDAWMKNVEGHKINEKDYMK